MDLTPAAQRWASWRRPALPTRFPYAAIEGVLIVLFAIQCARIVWILATPLGPIGQWRSATATGDPGAVLARFDPFFRSTAGGGLAVVTSAPVKLFGVRLDQATGRGSAIIATPDGVQSSFAVGDAVMPGLILKAVMLDHVTLDRGGATEQLYLDQSVAAPLAQPASAASAPTAPAPIAAPAAAALRAGLALAPRLESGTMTGVVVSPAGTGDVYRALGFLPGDVVTAMNGRRFRSIQEAGEAIGSLPGGSIVQIELERGGKVMTLTMRIGQ
jgi:general secretion pathway protein C